jgi:hypothetical protein
MIRLRPSVLLGLAVALHAPAAAAQTPATWELGVEAAYGPRFEPSPKAPPAYLATRNDVGHAYSTGLILGRHVAFGLRVLAVVRMAVPSLEGEMALGAGVGLERRVTPALSLRGAVVGGYKLLSNDSCECGGLEYQGAWARAEVGLRYFLLHLVGVERAPSPALASFDIFVAGTLGFDAVAARYPDGTQYGLHREDGGWRLGPDAGLGVGFVW